MNILVTGAWRNAEKNILQLEKIGHSVIFMQEEKSLLPCEYEWVEGVIGNALFVFYSIEKFVNLRYIQLTSVGFDRIPMYYIQKHNIEIHNATDVYSIPMAEFAISGVLQIYKQASYFYEKQRAHIWEKHRDLLELCGKTVCIVGCGNIGTSCARLFKAFGCNVIGINRTVRENESFTRIYSLEEMNSVLSEADILILTIALTEGTQHLVNKERLEKMKYGSVLVNISRGAVLDTQALIDTMVHLKGAVLDVFEEEPLNKDNPLWDMKNTIITPHNSFESDGNLLRLNRLILKNIKGIT